MSDCPYCRTFALEANALHEEIAGLNAEILKLTREKIALKGQRTKERKKQVESRDVNAILRTWRSLCHPNASIDLDGDRADIVRAALRYKTTGDRTQRRRICMDAVRGLALRPYMLKWERTANPNGATRRDDIEHALGCEKRIEEHAGYYRMAKAKPVEWKHAAWRAAMATERAWRDLWYIELRHDEQEERRAHWEREYGVCGLVPPQDKAAHLFIEEAAQEPPQEAQVLEPGRLFVIEGGRAA